MRDESSDLFGDGSGNKPLKSYTFSFAIFMDDLIAVLSMDFGFAFFSILFVFVYLTIHLRTFFLSSMGTLIIIFSFPFTMVIVAGIFQVSYFGTL